MYATFLNGIMIYLKSSFLFHILEFFFPMFLFYFSCSLVGYIVYGFMDD